MLVIQCFNIYLFNCPSVTFYFQRYKQVHATYIPVTPLLYQIHHIVHSDLHLVTYLDVDNFCDKSSKTT